MIGWLTRGQTVLYTIRRSAAPGSIYPGDTIMCRNIRKFRHAEDRAAQDSLLEQRRAIALLRDVLESDNLELAYRARFLLDMLDPLRGHFQIVKIRLGDTPRVTATAQSLIMPSQISQ